MFDRLVDDAGRFLDAVGVVVIIAGAVFATALLRRSRGDLYRRYRQQLGRSILLGLELLVAADIIRTVAVTPSAQSVAVLGGVVLIRTFLSFSLELEISGHWPWQRSTDRTPMATDPDR